ncbi:unnamed protein product [Amoebophrya sp. A120]|nr:unnamed protein product [Amoebophrya sp. A120]|eukprot:GSA120T00002774001.1
MTSEARLVRGFRFDRIRVSKTKSVRARAQNSSLPEQNQSGEASRAPRRDEFDSAEAAAGRSKINALGRKQQHLRGPVTGTIGSRDERASHSHLLDHLDLSSPFAAHEENLDRVAGTSLPPVRICNYIRDRCAQLLRDFGHKKDVQRHGRYVQDIMRSRSATEVPTVLSSRFLPEHADGGSPMDRILSDPVYQAAIRGQKYRVEKEREKVKNAQKKSASASREGGGLSSTSGASSPSTTDDYDDFVEDGEQADEEESTEEKSDNVEENERNDASPSPRNSTSVRTPKTMAHLSRLARAHAEDKKHKLYQMFWSPEAALAYLGERYVGSYAANLRVLSEVKLRCPGFHPKRMLDYGSGPAPSVAAALRLFPRSLDHVTCIEPSANMAQLAQYLLKGPQTNLEDSATEASPVGEKFMSVNGNIDFRWQSCLYDDVAGAGGMNPPHQRQHPSFGSCTAQELPSQEQNFIETNNACSRRYDLITLSYVQMEIRGQPSRDMLIRNLWNRLTYPGGMLLLIERGTPTGFRFLHHTREMFIDEITEEHFHFVAPCPHEDMCPLAVTGSDWCHFAQQVHRLPHTVYCKGSTAKFLEAEKFSFLAIRRGPGPRFVRKTEAACQSPEEQSYFWPRVVMPALKGGGHTLMDICSHCPGKRKSGSCGSGGSSSSCGSKSAPSFFATASEGAKESNPGWDESSETTTAKEDEAFDRMKPMGRFERISTSRSKADCMGHRFARHVMWGDLWRFPKRVNRPEARAYVPEKTRNHLDRLAQKAANAMGLPPVADGPEEGGAEGERFLRSSAKTSDKDTPGSSTTSNEAELDSEESALFQDDDEMMQYGRKDKRSTKPTFWREHRNSEYHYGR